MSTITITYSLPQHAQGEWKATGGNLDAHDLALLRRAGFYAASPGASSGWVHQSRGGSGATRGRVRGEPDGKIPRLTGAATPGAIQIGQVEQSAPIPGGNSLVMVLRS